MERLTTGIDLLDELLSGGIPAGGTILLVGRPGSGKTVFAHQMMFSNAKKGRKIVYLSTLSEPQVKIMKYQQRFSFYDIDEIQETAFYHDLGTLLRKKGAKHSLAEVDEILKNHQPDLLIIDTVRSIADLIPSIVDFREFIIDISVRTSAWGCTCLLLGEYPEEDIDIRPEGAIADGIIYLYGTEESKHQKRYLRVLKMRGIDYRSGEHVFKITSEGIFVFPRLDSSIKIPEYIKRESLSTGIKALDEITCGGIPQGSTTLISGFSGTGKTIIALHYAYAGLLNGEKVIYISFEEEPSQIVSGAAKLGLNLQAYIDSGQLYLKHLSPIELDADEHMYNIQKIVQETNAKRLVLDSISSYEMGIKDKVKYSDHILGMTYYFKSQGITLLLTQEIYDENVYSSLSKHGLSFMADNLLYLHYREHGPHVRRCFRIVKMRGSRHSSNIYELVINENEVMVKEIT